MHARYKREHGSDGAHQKSTTRGEVTTAEPVPEIRQWGWKRRPVSGVQQLGRSGGKFKTTRCVPKVFLVAARLSRAGQFLAGGFAAGAAAAAGAGGGAGLAGLIQQA